MEKKEVINKILSGGMSMEEIRAAAAQKRAEERAQAQQQLQKLDAGGDIDAEPEIATVVAAGPVPQPEPVVATIAAAPEEPSAPEILSTTVEFTNQELLEFLKGRAGTLITAADLSQRFKITLPIAAEIINDLKRENCIGEDNTVVPLANIEAIESTLREARVLSSKFIHIPPEAESTTVTPDISASISPKTESVPVVVSTDPVPSTSTDVDLNLNEPAPATNTTTTTSVDINIDDLKAVPAPATPAADPSAAPTAPAPIARASTMTERLFGTKTRRALVAGAFFLGVAGIYALKPTKSPDAAPAPAAEKAKPAPKAEGQKPAAEQAAQAQQQNKQEASVAVTKEQLLAAKLPEQIQESVIKIMAQPNAKDFITPFLKQAKKHQTEQLVQLTDPVINKIFGILNDTENAHLLNTAWSGKTGLTMSECLVDVNNTTCDIRANFSLIAKIYREILQETSGFSRLHDAQLPEKTITEMHAYVRAEIQKYLAKQAAAK